MAAFEHPVRRCMNDAADDGDTFRVSYEARQDKFLITCKESFTLLWRGGNTTDFQGSQDTSTYRKGAVGRVLGFGTKDALSEDDGSTTRPHFVRAPFRKNFKQPEYVILRIDGAENNVSQNPASHRSYAILIDNHPTNNEQSTIHTYDPPVPRFNRFRISFHDYDGELYDFQNHDHRLEVELISRKQKKLCAA
jgi:hypothetical protein